MDTALDLPTPSPTVPFVQVFEVWVPKDGRLVLDSGSYGDLDGFAAASAPESFGKGEGVPGKAWADARPVVLKGFEGSYFKRTEAANAAGLTAAVGVPVFDGAELKAVLMMLCGDDENRVGAIEVWAEADGVLKLDDGYYGAARHFEWVSQHTQFPSGQGLVGGVWAAQTPILIRDLGKGYRFVRAESAGAAGLTTGLGLPVPAPDGSHFVLTLLSAMGTPLARRFEIWDARARRMGATQRAALVDGLCERDGALWGEERVIEAWKGPVGRALGSGLPQVVADGAGLPAGYRSMAALPFYDEGAVAHIVALYS